MTALQTVLSDYRDRMEDNAQSDSPGTRETAQRMLSILAEAEEELRQAQLNRESLERRLRLAQHAAEKHHAGDRAACAREEKANERAETRLNALRDIALLLGADNYEMARLRALSAIEGAEHHGQ